MKSLLTFSHKLGVLPVNAGAALHLPRMKDTLAERILAEEEVQRLLALEPSPRNKAMLRLLYAGDGLGVLRSHPGGTCRPGKEASRSPLAAARSRFPRPRPGRPDPHLVQQTPWAKPAWPPQATATCIPGRRTAQASMGIYALAIPGATGLD